MKNRLTGKPACIAILAALLIISLADVILRGVVLQESMLSAPYMGEPFVTIVISVMLILFARREKDRLFYILCGAWLAYFVLNQLFGLPEIIVKLFMAIGNPNVWGVSTIIVNLLHVGGMICIIAIGGLLVEYMNDGTIYNKAFIILCIASVAMIFAYSVCGVYGLARGLVSEILILEVLVEVLNHLQRMVMVFLFVTFAYDSARKQLAKTKLD